MRKTLKHLTLSLFLLIAIFAVGATSTQAAKRKADAERQDAEASEKFWAASGKKLKIKPANNVNLKNCFLLIPKHYVFELNGQKYRLMGGVWYVGEDGYLATLSSPKIITAKYYGLDASSWNVTLKKDSLTVFVSDEPCQPQFEFKFPDGTVEQYKIKSNMKTFSEAGGEYVYFANAALSFNSKYTNGFSTDNKLYYSLESGKTGGKLYSGCIKRGGLMKTVSKGVVGGNFTGKVTNYFDEAARYQVFSKAFKKTSVIYKNGKPFTGWNTTNKSFVRGYYTDGRIDTSVNHWKKHKKKWYYLEKGVIYHNKNDKKGPSKKALKTTGLNYFGHTAAPKGLKYNYYLKSDGSLVADVFSVDKSWLKKNVRIMVNLKAGVDNVTFMGAYKGKYSIPLKTVVTTCSGSSSMRAKLVRGYHGRGWWGLGRTGRSRKRDFIFKSRYYYRNAVSILYSGALFHSARYLKHNNPHSLSTSPFNAMGKKNVTTKCVRLQLVNTKIVWNLSKKAKKASVKFVSKKATDKNAWLPFGNTELSDSTGVKYWKKNYDPSGKF